MSPIRLLGPDEASAGILECCKEGVLDTPPTLDAIPPLEEDPADDGSAFMGVGLRLALLTDFTEGVLAPRLLGPDEGSD